MNGLLLLLMVCIMMIHTHIKNNAVLGIADEEQQQQQCKDGSCDADVDSLLDGVDGDDLVDNDNGDEGEGEAPKFDPEKIREILKNMPGASEGMMQVLGEGDGGENSPLGYAQRQQIFNELVPHDTPFVMCEACRALVRRAHFLVKQRKENFKKTKFSEVFVNEMIDNICSPRSDEGKWITEYAVILPDDLEKEPKITLKRMSGEGFCEESCWLVENACQEIIEVAETDLIENLWKDKLSKEDLADLICKEAISDLAGSCEKPYPKMSKARMEEKRMYSYRKKSEMDLEFDKSNKILKDVQF